MSTTKSVRTSSIVFSPNGKTLASKSQDDTVRLWDIQNGTQKAVLPNKTSSIAIVKYSPDGRKLASASSEYGINIWNLSFFNQQKNKKIEEKIIKKAEKRYNLQQVNRVLVPLEPERNLYEIKPKPPEWPSTHPFHWLSKAQNGNVNAMLKLGITYHKDDQYEKAIHWYRKALKYCKVKNKIHLIKRIKLLALTMEPTHNKILGKIISQIYQNKLDRFCKFY